MKKQLTCILAFGMLFASTACNNDGPVKQKDANILRIAS